MLDDCGSKLSREHFVSESWLHELNRQHDLRVGGFRWQKSVEQADISPNALASKILCDRHNSALSSLDAIALRLFQALDEQNASGSGQQLLFLFSGHDVERWLLKVLCGLVVTQNVSFDRDTETTIPKLWFDILFGLTDFAEGQGLYICCAPGEVFKGPRGLLLAPIGHLGKLTAISVSICGYDLILAMEPIPDRELHGRKLAYRPLELYAAGREFEKSVLFSWRGRADLGTISVAIP